MTTLLTVYPKALGDALRNLCERFPAEAMMLFLGIIVTTIVCVLIVISAFTHKNFD